MPLEVAPLELQHGEKFGQLTVLRRFHTKRKHWEYALGCSCGYQGTVARARELMNGSVTKCYRCVRKSLPPFGTATIS